MYEEVRRLAPDQVSWATTTMEYHKAMKSPRDILKHAAWQHWQSPSLLQYDRDSAPQWVTTLGVEFLKVEHIKAQRWELQLPNGASRYKTSYVFSGASFVSMCVGWGGGGGRGAKVMDEAGGVRLHKRVTLLAVGLTTKLVESTMVGMPFDAVQATSRNKVVVDEEVWGWSDCLGAI